MRTSFISLMCCIAVVVPSFASAAARATGKGTYPGALPVLAGIETVREDLKLTSLQEAVLDSIRNEYRSEAQQIYLATNFKSRTSLAHAENALRRLQLKYNRRVLSTLNKTQKRKLQQIAVRTADGFLLLRKPARQNLSITPHQQAKIAKIEAKMLARLSKINRLSIAKRMSPLKRAIALHTLRQNSSKELLEVLTPRQKQELALWAKKRPPAGILLS